MVRWNLITVPEAEVLNEIGKLISLRMSPIQRCALPIIPVDNGNLCYWITNLFVLLQLLAGHVVFPGVSYPGETYPGTGAF
jgi:hypothetical protein